MPIDINKSSDQEAADVTPMTAIGLPQDPPMVPREMTLDEQLFHAVLYSNLGLIEWLIGEVSDVDVRDAQGYTALHRAVLANRTLVVELLLENGADPDLAIPTNAATLLHLAVAARNAQTVGLLLDSGADVDQLDQHGCSPLSNAVANGDVASVEVLLENNADTSLTDASGLTPLYQAVIQGNKPIVKLLLDDGADADVEAPNGTPLLHAATVNNRFLNRLMDAMGDVNVTDVHGNSALHVAITEHLPEESVRKLLEHLDEDQVNDRGESPLFVAVLNRSGLGVINAILEYSPLLDQQENLHGLTALHIAVTQGDEAVFDAIMDNGPDVDVRDVGGDTALDMLLQRPVDSARDRMEKVLREARTNATHVVLDRRSDYGQTVVSNGGYGIMGGGRDILNGRAEAATKTPERARRRSFWQWLWNAPRPR